MSEPQIHAPQMIDLDDFVPHPLNYREHPDDQIDEIIASMRQHGVYKNVVCCPHHDDEKNYDGKKMLLAGHGAILAAKKMGLKRYPATVLDVHPMEAAAKKVLAADNYLSHFAEDDDRKLTDLLKAIHDDDDLQGTGFTAEMLAAFAMVTRTQDEIEDFDEAAEWVGMPEYEPHEPRIKVIVNFHTVEDRDAFAKLVGQEITDKTKWIVWPHREIDDVRNVEFQG